MVSEKLALPQVGDIWKHFKGDLYKITGFNWDAEGDEFRLRVCYVKWKPLNHTNEVEFSRTIDNFVGPVDTRAEARFYLVSRGKSLSK